MALRKKIREAPEIDVSAFSDIAFLLIIFFILTTTFEKFVGNTVEIPAGAPSEEKADDKQTTLVLDAGKIHFNEETENISIDELRRKLKALRLRSKKEDMEKMILVEATDDVVYDTYFSVINAISEAGGVLAIIEQEE